MSSGVGGVASSASPARQVPPLASFTTIRVGGSPQRMVAVDSYEQAVQTLADLEESRSAYLPLGGGSNLVVTDADVDMTVVWMRNADVHVVSESSEAVMVEVGAGANWDDFVSKCVQRGWSGVECLSGIPGTVGATPIQNVGAYGAQVSDVIDSIHVWDRNSRHVRELTHAECEFGYRSSALKSARRDDGSPAQVVLSVKFRLQRSMSSAPLRYAELATALECAVGETTDLLSVRTAVLALRESKGMLLDEADHDTWSVGSFFVNPVVSRAVADALPDDTPRWPVADSELVKLSAAWLVEHAGFPKGFALPSSGAAVSTKHALALTNRGDATAAEIVELARTIRDAVANTYSVELQAEPVLVGLNL